MSLIDRLLGMREPTSTSSVLAVDRIACTGHGICAHILTDTIDLDEWGYPILHDVPSRPASTAMAIKLCPTRALDWVDRLTE
jgi:ferredoxin